MIRYLGQKLHPHSRIAVVANDAIGNFVVATPLLQMLREQWHPKAIDFFSGPRTEEFQSTSRLIDAYQHVFGQPLSSSVQDLHRFCSSRRYDLVINIEQSPYAATVAGLISGENTYVVGPCVGPEGRNCLSFADDEVGRLWQDTEWINPELPKKYPMLSTPFIGEIFCRLSYLKGQVPNYLLPTSEPAGKVPDVLIATAASIDQKLWPEQKWIESVRKLQAKGLSVGILGAKPSVQGQHWQGATAEDQIIKETGIQDLRGQYTLPEVVGALAKCRLVLSLDNGIMHLAGAVRTPTVALFRPGIHRLWAPPIESLHIVIPKNDDRVSEILVESVMHEVSLVL